MERTDFLEKISDFVPKNTGDYICYMIYNYTLKHRDILGFPRLGKDIPYFTITNDLYEKFASFIILCVENEKMPGADFMTRLACLLVESYDDEDTLSCGFWHSQPKSIALKLQDEVAREIKEMNELIFEEAIQQIPEFDESRMYPYDEREVSCFEDVLEYLRTWLRKGVSRETTYFINDKAHYRVASFRREDTNHFVLYQLSNHCFISAMQIGSTDIQLLSSFHRRYEDLLHETAERYCKFWKIPFKKPQKVTITSDLKCQLDEICERRFRFWDRRNESVTLDEWRKPLRKTRMVDMIVDAIQGQTRMCFKVFKVSKDGGEMLALRSFHCDVHTGNYI
jgi:hypothetical protein